MDIKLKQRILGIAVLISLLAFCLSLLLQGNKKNQPHIPPINIEPPISQLTPPNAHPTSPVSLPKTIPPLESNKNKTENVSLNTTPISAPTIQPTKPNNIATKTPPISTSPTPVSVATPKIAPTIIATPKPSVENLAQAPVHIKKTYHVKRQTTHNTPGDFVVQVGAFKESDHAEKLSAQLTKEGYTVDTHKIKSASGELTLVAVGGSGVSHASAEKIRSHLETQLKLTPIIKPVKSKGT